MDVIKAKLCRRSLRSWLLNIKKITVILGFMVLSTLSSPPIQAANLDKALVRLDRQAAQAAPGRVYIELQPSTAAGETQVHVTAGTAWSISTLASDFTVSTAQLPSGVSAWPGIGPALQVSGQHISFPSGDLTVGQRYGFYITGGFTTNPARGDNANYIWTLETDNGSTLESAQVMVPVVPADQITVTGSVPALSYYLDADLRKITSATTYQSGEEITYEITYASDLNEASDLKLQAAWDLGRIGSATTPTVNALEYVSGSATTAYGSAPALIDTVNRTITWEMTNVPAHSSDLTVRFTLRTLASYTGTETVHLSVAARLLEPAVTSDSTLTVQYRYQAPPTSTTPTPSPTPTVSTSVAATATPTPTPIQPIVASPSPTPTISPTPDPMAAPLHFRVINVSPNNITVQTHSEVKRRLRLAWGENTRQWQWLDLQEGHEQIWILENLTPDTTYYLALDASPPDDIAQSTYAFREIYTVRTASQPSPIKIANIALSQQGWRLDTYTPSQPQPLWTLGTTTLSASDSTQAAPLFALMPPQQSSELVLQLTQHESVTDIAFQLAKETTVYTLVSQQLVNTQPGTYQIAFTTPPETGQYDFNAQVADIYGNINTQTLGEITVSEPLTVVDAQTGAPIERANLSLARFDEQKQLYTPLPLESVLTKSQQHTNTQGEWPLALPTGKYQVAVAAIGYERQDLTFAVDRHTINYPRVQLQPTPFSLLSLGQYHFATLRSIWQRGLQHTLSLTQSRSFFHLLRLVSLAVLAGMTWIAFHWRLGLTWQHLPNYLWTHWRARWHLTTPALSYVRGRIMDEHQHPVSQAEILLTNTQTGRLEKRLMTDARGYWHTHLAHHHYTYEIVKPGWATVTGTWRENLTPVWTLRQTVPPPHTWFKYITTTWQRLLAAAFEAFLLLSLIAEFMAIPQLGLGEVMPFLLLSISNFLLWISLH